MRCIFCKIESSTSKSVEHIIPESLGNKNHVLPRGVVCDSCNNYFAIKIEKPLLEQPYFVSMRARNEIISKKGKIPIESVQLNNSIGYSEIVRPKENSTIIININDTHFFDNIANGSIKELIYPAHLIPPHDNYIVSRFLAKVTIEAFAQKFGKSDGGIDYLIDEVQFDEIRNFARYGKKYNNWPYSVRKIYSENEKFYLKGKLKEVDKLFEYDFLITKNIEFYFVIIIKGIEYSINVAGPELYGYESWLKEHNGISPLFIEKDTDK